MSASEQLCCVADNKLGKRAQEQCHFLLSESQAQGKKWKQISVTFKHQLSITESQ